MGPVNARQMRAKEVQIKTNRQLQQIYGMFDQSIDVVRQTSHQNDQNQKGLYFLHHKSSRILNVDSVLEQLLQAFQQKGSYYWGSQICQRFKKHFRRSFQQIWVINKQQFYQLLLSNIQFDTQQIKQSIIRLKNGGQQLPTRQSYQRIFYDVGASKIQECLPQSFIQQDASWQESFHLQSQEQKNRINLNIINASIISGQFQKQFSKSLENRKKYQSDMDFLPLFVSQNQNHPASNSQFLRVGQKVQPQLSSSVHIQNSSLVMPQTIFLDRMSFNSRAQIGDLVRFYKQFAGCLQQMFHSTSLISCPLKHFLYTIQEKMARKNIKTRKAIKTPQKAKRLIFREDEQGKKARARRQLNNNILLRQIADFTEAYTNFIWKFLELYELGDSKLGKLINIDTLYGIVLKYVWKFVEWIGERGYEYEEDKLQQIYIELPTPVNSKITQQKKRYLSCILQTLRGQTNPQKYLKKIVIFYRQVSKLSQTADDLLNIYQQLLVKMIKSGLGREIGVLRMRNVIQKLLRIDDYANGGQISYSWTTWSIIVEIFKGKLLDYKYGNPLKETKNYQQIKNTTKKKEAEWQNIMVEGSGQLISSPEMENA